MRCAIVGNGREGQWWQRFLSRHGSYTYEISDSPVTTPRAVNPCPLVVLAVPMSECGNSAQLVSELVRDDQLVLSVCGLMGPVEAALKKRARNFALLHRMIGPQVETMEGHRVLIHGHIKDTHWHDFFLKLLENLKGDQVEVTPSEHDFLVWKTQGEVRHLIFALAKALVENPTMAPLCHNVPFDGLMLVLDRVLAFGPQLSWDMMRSNPYAPAGRTELNANLAWVERASEKDFRDLFERLREMRGKDTIEAGSKALVEVLDQLHHRS